MSARTDVQVETALEQDNSPAVRTSLPSAAGAEAAKRANVTSHSSALPVLVSQDSTSTMASANSPATHLSVEKIKEGMAQVQALGMEVMSDRTANEETSSSPKPPVGLVRQLTMGGYEEAREETEITSPKDGRTSGANGSGKKRPRQDLQPETLLKRQESVEEDEPPRDKAVEGDDPLQLAVGSVPGLYRMHSLVDGDGRGRFLSIQRPDEHARDSPSIFSPPVVVDSVDSLFANTTSSSSAFASMAAQASAGRQERAVVEHPLGLEGGETAVPPKGPPVPITRQESWKEDVSDAGWRAW